MLELLLADGRNWKWNTFYGHFDERGFLDRGVGEVWRGLGGGGGGCVCSIKHTRLKTCKVAPDSKWQQSLSAFILIPRRK